MDDEWLNPDNWVTITVNEETWNWLMELLDAPPQENEKLRKLLTEPTVFDKEEEND